MARADGSASPSVNHPVVSTDIYSGSIEPSLSADANFSKGLSYYSNMARFGSPFTLNTQFGWDLFGQPDDRTTTIPLCPKGTNFGDGPDTFGNFFQGTHQSLEGGPGEIDGEPFPFALPKFKINSSPDCYQTQIGSVPFEPSNLTTMISNRLGVAQLSNRLLIPPAGFTVSPASQLALLGTGWIALPLIPSYTSPLGVPVGNQSWTLFLNAANFQGPVVFIVPTVWTTLQQFDRRLDGTGLDSRPLFLASQGVELGHFPTYAGVDSQGTRYRRAPQIALPTGAGGHAVIMQDEMSYSQAALWDAFAAWMAGGPAPTSFAASGASRITATQGYDATKPNSYQNLSGYTHINTPGQPDEYAAPDAVMMAEYLPSATSGTGIGVHGLVLNSKGQATLPEYFKEVNGQWQAIPASQVPAETGLTSVSFPLAKRAKPGPPPALNSPLWKAGPYKATLLDGSVVTYVWYRFIDQPAIQQMGLSASALQNLQNFVTTLHKSWGLNGVTIPAPTSGPLATLDPAQIVSPPQGLEVGYVPVVVTQQ